jgi:hypothetical protein
MNSKPAKPNDRRPPTVAQPRHEIPGENPEVARLTEMVIALLGELTVVVERLDTVERVLASTRLIDRAAIEGYVADAAAQGERDARRRQLIAKVLNPLRRAMEQQSSSRNST